VAEPLCLFQSHVLKFGHIHVNPAKCYSYPILLLTAETTATVATTVATAATTVATAT